MEHSLCEILVFTKNLLFLSFASLVPFTDIVEY